MAGGARTAGAVTARPAGSEGPHHTHGCSGRGSAAADAGGQLVQGRATETAQVSLDAVAQRLADAVTPSRPTPRRATLPASIRRAGAAGTTSTRAQQPRRARPARSSPRIRSAPMLRPASTRQAPRRWIRRHCRSSTRTTATTSCARTPEQHHPQVDELFVNDASCVSGTDLCDVEVVRFETASDPCNAAQDYQPAEPAAGRERHRGRRRAPRVVRPGLPSRHLVLELPTHCRRRPPEPPCLLQRHIDWHRGAHRRIGSDLRLSHGDRPRLLGCHRRQRRRRELHPGTSRPGRLR